MVAWVALQGVTSWTQWGPFTRLHLLHVGLLHWYQAILKIESYRCFFVSHSPSVNERISTVVCETMEEAKNKISQHVSTFYRTTSLGSCVTKYTVPRKPLSFKYKPTIDSRLIRSMLCCIACWQKCFWENSWRKTHYLIFRRHAIPFKGLLLRK